MILHVCTLEKFMPPLVEVINNEFGAFDHQFWFSGGGLNQYPIENASNIFIKGNTLSAQFYAYRKLLIMLHRSSKVMLHGLFDFRVIVVLAIFPWLLRKCYWVIWGADLYRYQTPKPRVRDKIREKLRAFVIKRVGYLVTYIPGDVELARKWYGARGKYRECLMYLSNVVNPEQLEQLKIEEKDTKVRAALNIQIGNSADPSNNHIDILRMLLPYRKSDLRIYAPLSYGDENYAQDVITFGKEWFGDRFIPITTYMSFGQYLDFLKRVDMAIFNHNRQQAMGNTITLLALGKTVYMRSDLSHWELFQVLGLKVCDVCDFDKTLLNPRDALNNKKKVIEFFSRQTLINQYAEIFSE